MDQHTWIKGPKLGQTTDMGIVITFSLPFDPPHANKKGLSIENDTENIAPWNSKERWVSNITGSNSLCKIRMNSLDYIQV